MRKYFFANAFWGLVSTITFLACGDSSDDSVSVNTQMRVDALEDLPNCSEKREGETAFLLEDNSTYKCHNGKWEMESASVKTVPTMDDLLNCTSKSQGDTVQVVAENAIYQCIDGKWLKYRTLIDQKQSQEDLLACVPKREGNLTYVADEQTLYQCLDGKWVRYDVSSTVEPNKPMSSSSIKNEKVLSSSSVTLPKSSNGVALSSSVIKSSSSVAKLSSSIVVISSSAAKSSSSIVKYSSSKENVPASYAFDTWLGLEGISRVDTRLDNGSKTSGYWFGYDDRGDRGESRIIWADGTIKLVAGNTPDSLANVISYCNGVCGTAILDKGLLSYNPFVGIGFNVVGNTSKTDPTLEAGDASSWGGVCITYASAAAPSFELGLGDDVDASIDYANPAASLPKASAGLMKQLAWSDFKQPSWYKGSKKISGLEAAKQLVSMKFKIQSVSNEYKFNICGIGPYGGACPTSCKLPPRAVVTSSSSEVKSSSSVARSSSGVALSAGSTFETWNGFDWKSQVNTGLDNGSKTSGYWFSYDDRGDKGKSQIVWADGSVGHSDGRSPDSLENVIQLCNGICGTAILDKGDLVYNPFVGIGFNVVGNTSETDLTPEAGDASAWGGICITYKSQIPPSIELGLGDEVDASIGYANPAASLVKSTDGTVKNIAWADFKQPSWYKGDKKMPGPEAAKQLVALKIKMQGSSGQYDFKFCAIGPYGGDCPQSCGSELYNGR